MSKSILNHYNAASAWVKKNEPDVVFFIVIYLIADLLADIVSIAL